MDRIALKQTGEYTLALTLTDADGEPVAPTHLLIKRGSDVVLDEDVSSASVPVEALSVGVHYALLTGGGFSTETHFEVVDYSLLLDDIRRDLRLSTTAFDDEVNALIVAAMKDLEVSGVSTEVLAEPLPAPLVRLAITVYCKAHFGLDNPDTERYLESFRSIETALALSEEFRA